MGGIVFPPPLVPGTQVCTYILVLSFILSVPWGIIFISVLGH